MKITDIAVENYKSIKFAKVPISDFVCIVGENNAGKSSLMQALLIFLRGPKLSPSDYYDAKKEILITVNLSGITEEALNKLDPEHRPKLAEYVKDEKLILARRYATDGSSKFRLVTKVPKDVRYRSEILSDEVAKNKSNIPKYISDFFPEVVVYNGIAPLPKTQKDAKDLFRNFVATFKESDLIFSDVPLATGIDNSIIALLPEPIYIPAVKDFSDDLKTKESASFGKLLSILLDVIESDLTEAADTFDTIRKKLNRFIGADGTTQDLRLEKVREIEKTIQKNLQDTFHNVEIEIDIPPPQVKSILAGATIMADDGVRGAIENKGDGFKRAITFSVLRTYVQLSQSKEWQKESVQKKTNRDRFIFLFEEPELYLHPKAQNILFEALSLISATHQVAVTSHSPLFFSHQNTKTFIKIIKSRAEVGIKPFAQCFPIDLREMSEKDKFQLISFETNNLGFFSRKIVLVEGDSEVIVLPHISSLLNPAWDFKSTSTNIVKINGKGSFKRYREFFEKFGVTVSVIADLDIVLEDFNKTEPSPRATALREELLGLVDEVINNENLNFPPPYKLMKEELQRKRVKDLFTALLEARKNDAVQEQIRLLDEIFVFELTRPRLEVLVDNTRQNIVAKKRELFSELRKGGIFVLESGAIEAYYPAATIGKDKPTMAQAMCNSVTDGGHVRALCNSWEVDGTMISEFDLVFGEIFKDIS